MFVKNLLRLKKLVYILGLILNRIYGKKTNVKVAIQRRRYLIAGLEGLEDTGIFYRDNVPDKAQAKIEEADQVCDHVIDLLYSGATRLSSPGEGYQPIDWHKDFHSDYRWDDKGLYLTIPFGHEPGVDIK